MSMDEKAIYRVLDANLNRAREGLRVMEEVARFVTETKRYARALKTARTKLQKATLALPSVEKLFLSRNSDGDLGKDLNPKLEFKRNSIAGIFEANAKRVEEALRVLEEFSKLISPSSAKQFKALRFNVYQLEKEFLSTVLTKLQ